jgi:PhoPQ-activated pathogenicity-related protein
MPPTDPAVDAVNELTVSRRRFHAVAAAASGAAWLPRGLVAGESATAAAEPTVTGSGPLAAYVAADDPATRVEPVALGEFLGGTWQTVRLVSQRWRGVEWMHELSLFVPGNARADATTALYWIDGGSARGVPATGAAGEPSSALRTLAPIATAVALPAAVIRQVPYQPMFSGLQEDDLIAHTFTEFARTGDGTWPLLLPMVKAAVAGMDAVVAMASDRGLDIGRFVVTGASKRGWTTWLAAATDRRVVGIVPLVIDMLALDRHLRLQVESFGGLSEQLVPYTARGIDKLLATDRGGELIEIVDPFRYRNRLALPKLIALGTNDPYWPLGAVDLYREELPGPHWVSYCPNAGHGLPMPRIAGLVAAMGRHASGAEPLPLVNWRFAPDGNNEACLLSAEEAPERITLWQAAAPTRDFRQVKWSPTEVTTRGPEWRIPLAVAQEGWTAAFVELHYPRPAVPLVLSTAVRTRPARS